MTDVSICTLRITMVVIADLPNVVLCILYVAIEDLDKVKDALEFFSDWNRLGLKLGLHPDLLKRISRNKQEVEDQLEEMLRNWLQMNCMDSEKEPTWSQLVAAVKPIDRALSIRIEKKYLS